MSCSLCPSTTTTDYDSSLEPEYQAAYEEWLYENYYPCPPVDTTAVHEQSPTVQATAFTHTFPIPVTQLVDPSSISAYAHSSEASHSGNTSAVCSPPISPSSSGSFDTSESDRDGDYVPPLDERDQQHRRKRTQKRSKTASKPPHSVVSSPARSVSSGSRSSSSSPRARRANSYRRNAPSRNPQCEDAAAFVDKDCGFQCPASGCGYKQGNRRSPEFKRHLITHGRWMNPGKWTCCGVGIGSAHLYGLDVRQEVTAEERFRAGAYIFKGQWMIGGCMTTFSRRDALKRHIDNRNIPCVGNMKTYSF